MLKKSLIIATAMFAAVVSFQPTQQAEAKIKIGVNIGIPAGPFYGGGYYGGGYYGNPHGGGYYGNPHGGGYYGNPHRGYRGGWRASRISCARGRQIVRNSGYRFIVAVDCRGRTFKYRARIGGNNFLVKLDAQRGRIKSRRRI